MPLSIDLASIASAVLTVIVFGAIVIFVRSTTTGTIEVIAESGGASDTRRALVGPTVTGRWHGHEAEWKFRGGVRGHRCTISIAVPVPIDLSVSPRGALTALAVGAPPQIELDSYAGFCVRATNRTLAERLLDEAIVRDAVSEALTDSRDILRVSNGGVQVTRTVDDIDDRPMALMKAQSLAMTVVEHLDVAFAPA